MTAKANASAEEFDTKGRSKFDLDDFDIEVANLPTSAAGRKSNYDNITAKIIDKIKTLPADKDSVTILPPDQNELDANALNTIVNGLRNNLRKRKLDQDILITRRGGGVFAYPADREKMQK